MEHFRFWRFLLGCIGGGEEVYRDETETQTQRSWADLPELIVRSIAIRLCRSRDITAFRRVCTTWRSALPLDAAAENLIRREPLIVHMVNLNSDPVISNLQTLEIGTLYGIDQGRFFVAGQNFGHLIMMPHLDYSNRPPQFSILLLDIYNLTKVSYRAKPPQPFLHASLTAPPTSPNCLLVLVSNSVVQYCSLGGWQWIVKEYPDGIIPRQPGRGRMSRSVVVSTVAIEDRLYVACCRGRVFEVMIAADFGGSSGEYIGALEYHGSYPVLGAFEGNLVAFCQGCYDVMQYDPLTWEWDDISENDDVQFIGCCRRLPLSKSLWRSFLSCWLL